MLYLIIQNNFVKVGFTSKNTATQRQQHYFSHNPEFQGFLDVIDGDEEAEKEIHHNFFEDNEYFSQVNDTEWYECLNNDLLETIKKDKFNAILEEPFNRRSFKVKQINVKTCAERVSDYKRLWFEECRIRDDLKEELEALKKAYDELYSKYNKIELDYLMLTNKKRSAIIKP